MAEESETTPIRIDPNEAQALWQKQTDEARALLVQFRNAPDFQKEAIHDGIRRIIRTARPMQPVGSEKDVSALASAVGDCLEQSLSFEDKPPGVHAIKGKHGIFFRHNPRTRQSGPQILPAHVSLMVEHYGLSTGIPKPAEQLAIERGVNVDAIYTATRLAAQRILHFPAVSDALSALSAPPKTV